MEIAPCSSPVGREGHQICDLPGKVKASGINPDDQAGRPLMKREAEDVGVAAKRCCHRPMLISTTASGRARTPRG